MAGGAITRAAAHSTAAQAPESNEMNRFIRSSSALIAAAAVVRRTGRERRRYGENLTSAGIGGRRPPVKAPPGGAGRAAPGRNMFPLHIKQLVIK
ncbi:hypothetical protein Sru01_23600 [Sphaerisporangium rufum]|uniref:Uncharacterized protein n=1 Tax=Sphaerisporangium rufum TaxID=1381558 RepID=A0A919R1M5_9ACTN|nr:hypothetical protein Sru01_23600 [Sphaerisporangium rufum]